MNNGLRLTLQDATQAITTLAITHRLPKDVSSEKLGRVWVDVLEGIEPGELKVAVKRFLRSDGQFFPKPGKIRELALAYRAEVAGPGRDERSESWNQTLDGPCPVCGARLRLLTPEEQGIEEVFDVRAGKMVPLEEASHRPPDRHGVLHDTLRHQRARVPFVGFGTPLPSERRRAG